MQSATEYPCAEIVTPGGNLENLRKRVERSVLNSENMTKNRSGITNVRIHWARALRFNLFVCFELQAYETGRFFFCLRTGCTLATLM